MEISKKIVGIASTPDRVEGLKDTIKCLSSQVDHIYVWLNEYKEIPNTPETNVTFHLSKENIGAIGKFKVLDFIKPTTPFYFFTCDDDILYPPDYIKNNISQYVKGSIQSSHGKIFPSFPITDYKFGDISGFYFGGEIINKKEIHISGTGVCMMSSEIALQIPYDSFTTKNMVDVWVSCWAYSNNIPQFIVTHPSNWLIPNQKINQNESIWVMTQKNDLVQVQIINHYFHEG